METVVFEGKEYTSDFLRNAIEHYNLLLVIKNIPLLHTDIWREIMLHCSANTLKNLCLTHKISYKLYNGKIFWKDKFDYDALPQLVIYRKYKVGSIYYKTHRKYRKPNIAKAYPKMLIFHDIAVQFINTRVLTGQLTYFIVIVKNIDLLFWLPSNIIEYNMYARGQKCYNLKL